MRKAGYYWAEVYNELAESYYKDKVIVQVVHTDCITFTDVQIRSFEHGYLPERYVEFLHDDPLT